MWPNKTTIKVCDELSRLRKTLYMGPRHHIEPTMYHYFNNVDEFVFIDTQPRSELDNKSFSYDHYKQTFMKSLIDKCNNFGYELESKKILNPQYHSTILSVHQIALQKSEYPDINPCLYEFKNKYTDKKIKYYVSTNIECNMTYELQKDIEECDSMIVSGYFPTVSLKKYFPKPKALICFTDTVYPEYTTLAEPQDNDFISSVTYMNDLHASKYFNSYYICSHFSTHIDKCVNLIDIGQKSAMEYEYNDYLVSVDIS